LLVPSSNLRFGIRDLILVCEVSPILPIIVALVAAVGFDILVAAAYQVASGGDGQRTPVFDGMVLTAVIFEIPAVDVDIRPCSVVEFKPLAISITVLYCREVRCTERWTLR
jgi:hypothetical protein